VATFLDTGELVPDEIVIRVVDEHFAEGGPLEDGFILDGFPRTLVQAEALERVLVGHPLDLVLDLEVPTEEILERIAGRRVCVQCGATYHVTAPPEHPWSCDACGGVVVQRDDDTEDAVRRRLELYEQVTVPIIDFYADLGKLVVVDGTGSSEDVSERLLKEIDGRSDYVGRWPAR
jgi:adenylate kinase